MSQREEREEQVQEHAHAWPLLKRCVEHDTLPTDCLWLCFQTLETENKQAVCVIHFNRRTVFNWCVRNLV